MENGFVIVCYDIPDTKVRNRLVYFLFAQGLSRIQLSVFYGVIPVTRISLMTHQLQQDFPQETDKILIIPICKNCVSRLVLVHGSLPKERQSFIVI